MFRIEHRDHTKRWKRFTRDPRFNTERAAWDYIATLDPDGIVDTQLFRVMPIV